MSDTAYVYSGTELDVFASARNWKRYWASQLAPYIAGSVLEVGAGLGTNTLSLQKNKVSQWYCLEPDGTLLARLKTNLAGKTRVPTEVGQGTIARLAGTLHRFDSILYIDVLEHIKNDRDEIAQAVSCLSSAGRLIVLAPAHQSLFSPFDHAIGHFRRYNARMLRALTPPGAHLLRTWYLDSAGFALSLANRVLLKQSQPGRNQILTWDRTVIPISRALDPLLRYRFGKTVLAVWAKE